MDTQEFDKIEISRRKLSEMPIAYSPISIRGVINYIKELLEKKVDFNDKNCSTSLIIERDDLSIEDVYIKIRFCVNRPRNEVYAFCRKLKYFPLFLTTLISIEEENETHSFWRIRLPKSGQIVSLNMVITERGENEMMRWTTEESDLMTEGNIMFLDAPEADTTELRLLFSCKCTFNLKDRSLVLPKSFFKKLIKKDIEKFKKLIEIYINEGEIPSSWI